jgi:hypothetical protein
MDHWKFFDWYWSDARPGYGFCYRRNVFGLYQRFLEWNAWSKASSWFVESASRARTSNTNCVVQVTVCLLVLHLECGGRTSVSSSMYSSLLYSTLVDSSDTEQDLPANRL